MFPSILVLTFVQPLKLVDENITVNTSVNMVSRVFIYSTPFVFLADTFTGKFLGFGNVGRGHSFRNYVPC